MIYRNNEASNSINANGKSISNVYVCFRRWYHVSRQNRELFVSLVGTFGGGVFLATCFLDLLVDVNEEFHHFLEEVILQVSYVVVVDRDVRFIADEFLVVD